MQLLAIIADSKTIPIMWLQMTKAAEKCTASTECHYHSNNVLNNENDNNNKNDNDKKVIINNSNNGNIRPY